MAKMTESQKRLEIIGRYMDTWPDGGFDAREMSSENFDRLPELMAMALERGSELTLEEVGIEGEVPPLAMI